MDLSTYDAKILVWKTVKISTNTCVNVSKKHPYITSCFILLSLIYICCPLLFWILIYSLPLVVSTWVVLSFRDSRRRLDENESKSKIEREHKERESGVKFRFAVSDSDDHSEEVEEEGAKRIKKTYSRVHSVRRRRAKELSFGDDRADERSHAAGFNARDRANQDTDEDETEDEKNAFPSTFPDTNTIDKKTLVEGSPKEIREVEVNFPLARAQPEAEVSIDHELYQNLDVARSLKLLKDEEDVRDETSKAMDVNIAEAERNKRLESLIARRRSQKMMDLQAKKALANTEATLGAHMPPISIPKINTWCSPNKAASSPGPGSAPSVLIPMRNPFDLPYDPQEEKLDLTGDSFQQEFATGHGRDFMFCRHESFSLGPSVAMDFFDDRDEASSIDDFGFRRRRSSMGYYFPKPENEESDIDFGATTEAESESKSNIDSPNSDHIKEVIQVHKNTSESSHSAEGPDGNTRPSARDELSLNSNTSSSSMGSSEEDERPPMCKINREAILKSLSMRRNSVSVPDIEMEGNDQLQDNNLSYANSALENASRLKQQYFADKPQKRHGMTFSIASDMQVEVSELSSPPLTIGENMSYQDDASAYDGEMERNTSWDGLESWAGSSRMSEAEDNDTRLTRTNEAGASRNRRLPGSTDDEKHCIISSSSTSEVSESHTNDLCDRVGQTTSPESNTSSEESPASEDRKSFEAMDENMSTNEPIPSAEGEHEPSSTTDSNNNPPQERSPKSVLQPTLSVASFEHEGDNEVQQSAARHADRSSSNALQNLTPLSVQFSVGSSSNAASQEKDIQESTHNEEGRRDKGKE